MNEDILQALTNFVAVAVGLLVLWSAVGAMKPLGPAARFWAALTAGFISAAATLLFRLWF